MGKKKAKTPAVKSKADLANELTVEKLLPEINANHRECIKSGRDAIEYAVQAGELLWKLKESVKHGDWLPLLEKRCDCSARCATNYMKVAASLPKLVESQGKGFLEDATVDGCIKLIGQSKAEPAKKANRKSLPISATSGDAESKQRQNSPAPSSEPKAKPPEPITAVDDGPLNDEPEEDLDFDAQVKQANSKIESFCRQLVKFYEDNCPKLQSVDHMGRFDSALAHVRSACDTLRTCKYDARPCPKCGGSGCARCQKESDFGAVTGFTYRQLAG